MKRLLKNSQGFTLVELMVVVAIIGILSAIAVPNFKKYQAKSKQSEAKIQLAAVYSTEVGAQTDYDTFATCLGDLGYDTPPKGYYIVGFSATEATSQGIIVARSGNAASCTAGVFAIAPNDGNAATTDHLKANSAAAAVLPTAAEINSTPPTSTTFMAGASGNIAPGSVIWDRWTINQSKTLINAVVDL